MVVLWHRRVLAVLASAVVIAAWWATRPVWVIGPGVLLAAAVVLLARVGSGNGARRGAGAGRSTTAGGR